MFVAVRPVGLILGSLAAAPAVSRVNIVAHILMFAWLNPSYVILIREKNSFLINL